GAADVPVLPGVVRVPLRVVTAAYRSVVGAARGGEGLAAGGGLVAALVHGLTPANLPPRVRRAVHRLVVLLQSPGGLALTDELHHVRALLHGDDPGDAQALVVVRLMTRVLEQVAQRDDVPLILSPTIRPDTAPW